MRNFVMSDMHGNATATRALLEHAGVDLSKDKLRFLGDYIDRGPNSIEVLRLVYQYQQQGAKVHMGNHEQMLLMWVAGAIEDSMFLGNGGDKFLKSLEKAQLSQEKYENLLRWIASLMLYDEDDEYFYVHAGVHPFMRIENQTTNEFLWIRDEFLNIDAEELNKRMKGKIVVHGHTPMKEVCFDGARINTDIGAGGCRQLALVELTEKIAYVYDFGVAYHEGIHRAITVEPIQNSSAVSVYR